MGGGGGKGGQSSATAYTMYRAIKNCWSVSADSLLPTFCNMHLRLSDRSKLNFVFLDLVKSRDVF